MASRLKKGDEVYVISGSAKGEKGKIVSVDVRRQRVCVEGVNMLFVIPSHPCRIQRVVWFVRKHPFICPMWPL